MALHKLGALFQQRTTWSFQHVRVPDAMMDGEALGNDLKMLHCAGPKAGFPHGSPVGGHRNPSSTSSIPCRGPLYSTVCVVPAGALGERDVECFTHWALSMNCPPTFTSLEGHHNNGTGVTDAGRRLGIHGSFIRIRASTLSGPP